MRSLARKPEAVAKVNSADTSGLGGVGGTGGGGTAQQWSCENRGDPPCSKFLPALLCYAEIRAGEADGFAKDENPCFM